MNVNVASSIFFLAGLFLLPAGVECQRHAREEGEEYEIARHRKRATPIATYFQGANLKKVCGICHHKFDISLQNCISGKREARYKCLLIAKGNQKFFESHLHGKKAPPAAKRQIKHIVKRSPSLATFFKGDNLPKVCSICHSDFHIDESDCLSGRRKGKYKCMVAVKKNRQVFDLKMSSGSSAPAASASSTVPTGDEYFTPENMPKTCKVCKIFKVDPDECIANADSHARKHCRNMVREMPNAVAKQWKKLPGKDIQIRLVRKRSAAFKEDYFKGKNLPKVCKICQRYYAINETECIMNRHMATDQCRKKVEEHPRSFNYNWTSSNPSDVGQETDDFGTAEEVLKICSFCDEQLNFDFTGCVVGKNDVRKMCKKLILGLDSMMKKAFKNQSRLPRFSGELQSASQIFITSRK